MKITLLLLAGFLTTTVLTTMVNAQDQIASVSVTQAPSSDHSGAPSVSMLIVKKFYKEYQGTSNEIWAATTDGFAVRFTVDDIRHMTFFDNKGNIISQIRYLSEKKLPVDVRNLIKSSYEGYTIKHIQEVSYSGVIVFLVTIENKTSGKILRLIDTEMDVWKEYTKSK